MPLQRRNQIWQTLEQGAGKRCLECAYSAAQSCQCLYSAFHSIAEENPKRRTFSLRLIAKNNVRQASVEAVVHQGTLVFSSHLLSKTQRHSRRPCGHADTERTEFPRNERRENLRPTRKRGQGIKTFSPCQEPYRSIRSHLGKDPDSWG